MCGVLAWLGQPGSSPDEILIRRAADRLAHRGPDDAGYSSQDHVGLAHRRLAIIDLDGACQPMAHASGLRISFNGEIYNFRELRDRLSGLGHDFRLDSDTEVLAAACAQWGPEAVRELEGMYAFVVDDPVREIVWAARDPMGQKPLFACDPRFIPAAAWVFTSELKALLPEASRRVDRAAALRFLAYDFVPEDEGIFEGVQKLLPGESWILDRNNPVEPRRQRFFPLQPGDKAEDDEAYLADLENRLEQAVRRRLVADVPLGVFLSGGIDSSLITALAVRHREAASLKTFSIGFEEASFDESEHAHAVAKHLGTDHSSRIVSAQDLLDVVPLVMGHQDEPFGDPSIIPTYLLSRFARQQVTVALGGDGGDELFLGYPTFVAEALRKPLSWLPRFSWQASAAAAQLLPVGKGHYPIDYKLKRFLAGASRPLPDRHQVWIGGAVPEVLRRLAPTLDEGELYGPSRRTWQAATGTDFDRLTQVYAQHYLAAGVLQKGDRASMMVSLELRAPFLDRDVVRAALSCPQELRLSGQQTKVALRKMSRKLLPADIVERPKKGFGIPLADWLRGPLKDWLGDLLSADTVRNQGLFESSEVRDLFAEHQGRQCDHGKLLWNLACLSAYLQGAR